MKKISTKQKIALIIFGLFLCVVLLEVGLRIGGFVFLALQEYRNRISIRQKGTYRIMCLGESTTAGGKHAYPHQLEEILNQRDIGIKFSVINKGVPAVSTSYILAQLEDNLNRYKPEMVITMMGINECSRHIPYEDIDAPKILLSLRSFRTYKLTRLLWLHIVTKVKEAGIYKVKENKGLTTLHSTFSIIGSKERYAEQTNSTQADEIFKKALELNPRNDWIYVELGWCYMGQGKLTQAEESFKKAIELNPRNDRAYVELGWFYNAQGKSTQADEIFKKAIELNPRNDWIYVELGRHYIHQGKLTQAEESFKKAIELNPRNDGAYVELGRHYMDQGKLTQAEESFKKAIELNPRNDGAYKWLAVLYKKMGKYESAEKYYKKANKLGLKYYNPMACHNYKELKKILDKKGIKLVCVQYPMRSIEPLKKIFEPQEGIIFVDNKEVFEDALQEASYREYFTDFFGEDFGHCTPKGNRLLAENIANAILKECFNE